MNALFSKLKTRPALFFINIAFALIAILSAVIFAAVDSDNAATFSVAVVIVMICGGVVQIAAEFVPLSFMPLAATVLYAAAVGLHIDAILVSLSDMWTGVNIYHGNNEIAVAFAVIFVACAVESVVSCFMHEISYKKGVEVYEDIAK